MSVFKYVHMKFWQNDFVLGLTAEEKYFYIYLITNSMTTQCGIYKFNRRLAELETGFDNTRIEKLLRSFEEYGKVIVSKSSTEIMLVNWFKHNFKNNKKTILLINSELREIKDKELLESMYVFCSRRQYPTAELFRGVILPETQSQGKTPVLDDFPIVQEDAGVKVQLEEMSGQDTEEKESTAVGKTIDDQYVNCNKTTKHHREVVEDNLSVLDDCEEEDIWGFVQGKSLAVWCFEDNKLNIHDSEESDCYNDSAKNTA